MGDPDVPADDGFDAEERARLVAAVEDGVEDFERGDHAGGFDFIAQMRVKRDAADREAGETSRLTISRRGGSQASTPAPTL